MVRVLLAVAALALVWGDDMSTQYDRTAHQMSELLLIREQMQSVYSPFAQNPTAKRDAEVRDLGDAAESNQPAELKQGRTYALLQLDRAIGDYSEPERSLGLGEARDDNPPHHQSLVDQSRLNKLIDVPEDGAITEAVKRLTYFLQRQRSEHKTLSR